jgi:hypothetical protein
LENGKRVPLPPNIHSVPALLLVKDQYRVIMGEEIVGYLTPAIEKGRADATGFDGEPMAASSNGASSLGFVPYGSSAGTFIPTPPETYKPNKIPENITIEMLNGQYTQDRASFEKPVM